MKYRLTILSTILAAACGSAAPEPPLPPGAMPAGTLVAVRDTTIDATIDADGVAAPIEQATVSTKLMGTVVEVLVHEGDHVSRGQPLARIDARDVDAKRAQAAAAVSAAQAGQSLALAQARRMRALHADSAAPKAALDAAESGLQQADAAVRAAQAMTNEVDAVKDYAVVRAPFDGIVTKRFADVGTFAAPGMPLVQVQDASRLRVTVTTTPAAAQSLKRGAVVEATIDGQVVRGIVEGVVPSMAGGVYMVNATVANPGGKLPAGTSATVRIPSGRRRALMVPAVALVHDGDLTALRVGRSNTADLRWVKTGATRGTDVEILSGVSAGEQVLVPSAKGA
ncbi:MAG: efflux RND transporter periplasmic adaptor subunit [Proteobacteria bacterium]|nr:efflux RND transporter periplasmic adaptor subunit [Pseudomonadota bacterium]